MQISIPRFVTVGPMRRFAPHDVIGVLVGVLLPLIAAALYRTYTIVVTPNWLDLTRQMGLIFVAGELGVILWLRGRGYSPLELMGRVPRVARWLLWLFLATFWISSAFVSRFPAFSLVQSMVWVVHLIFGGAVYELARRDRTFDVTRLGEWFCVGVAAIAIWTAIHFLSPLPGTTITLGWSGLGAAIPGFISARLFGAWTGAVAVMLLGLLWRTPNDDRRTVGLYVGFALAAGLTIWTGTRAAVLAMGISVFVAAYLFGSPTSKHFTLRVVLAVLLATVIASLLVPYNDPYYRLYDVTEYTSVNHATSGRADYWISALKVASERPLLGWGAASAWWSVSIGGFFHAQPHNALIQFFLSWGLIPTIAFVIVLATATLRVHQDARRLPQIVPLVMAIDALLTMSMFDGMFYFARFLLLFAVLFGIAFGLSGQDGFPSRSRSARLRSNPQA